MSSGVSYGEQLVYDLERLSKNFPSVPVMIILMDMPLSADTYMIDGRKEVRRVREEIRKLLGHTGPVYDVAYSPTGRLLASSGNDRLDVCQLGIMAVGFSAACRRCG